MWSCGIKLQLAVLYMLSVQNAVPFYNLIARTMLFLKIFLLVPKTQFSCNEDILLSVKNVIA